VNVAGVMHFNRLDLLGIRRLALWM